MDAGAIEGGGGASTATNKAKAARVLKPGQIGNVPFRLLPRGSGSAMDGGECVRRGVLYTKTEGWRKNSQNVGIISATKAKICIIQSMS